MKFDFNGSFMSSGAATPPNPSDGVPPVLDALELAGRGGATSDSLAAATKFDANYLSEVLKKLQTDGMVREEDTRFLLTNFGTKAKYIITR
jgi:Mn-dependent DtxR family transcriptional regulator